jgi:hypothetical protein
MDFPTMYKIRQNIKSPELKHVEKAVVGELGKLDLAGQIKPGDRIAVTAGSRGIYRIDKILRTVIDVLKSHQAKPFIVPAMGSHGNGTAQGQVEVLKSLNITEDTMGAPIESSMDVVQVATSSSGFPVLVDKIASEADGVAVVNRVKPHTEFEGPIESGLMKMMAIGLGKHKGCFQVHKQAVNYGYSKIIPEIGSLILNKLPVVFGLGIVENLFDTTACVAACRPDELYETESQLLEKAKQYMARLPFEEIDILVIDEMGKNISGTGMDTNVIGRIMFIGEKEPDRPKITRIVVLDVTPQSHGNAVGIGLADITTEHVVNQLDTKAMATNALAAMTPEKVRIPVGLPTDKDAIEAAMETIGAVEPLKVRLVHIKNTLQLETLHISHALKHELVSRTDLELIEEVGPLSFDEYGRLQLVDV